MERPCRAGLRSLQPMRPQWAPHFDRSRANSKYKLLNLTIINYNHV